MFLKSVIKNVKYALKVIKDLHKKCTFVNLNRERIKDIDEKQNVLHIKKYHKIYTKLNKNCYLGRRLLEVEGSHPRSCGREYIKLSA